MAIKFTDIDIQVGVLKKARGVIGILMETSTDDDTDSAWALSAAFDVVHDVITTLEGIVKAEAESRRKGENYVE